MQWHRRRRALTWTITFFNEPAPQDRRAQDGHSIAEGAEALLREHPDAQVCALASNGLIVPVPQTVGLWGQGLIEGRALIDNVVAADRTAVVRLWLAAQQEGAAATKVRMLATPSKWSTLHFIDLREVHGVFLGVILPSDEDAGEAPAEQESTPGRAALLHADRGRGRARPRRRRRLHRDVRLHRARSCSASRCSTRSTPTTRAARSRAGSP